MSRSYIIWLDLIHVRNPTNISQMPCQRVCSHVEIAYVKIQILIISIVQAANVLHFI